jgi:hypothetical protein
MTVMKAMMKMVGGPASTGLKDVGRQVNTTVTMTTAFRRKFLLNLKE